MSLTMFDVGNSTPCTCGGGGTAPPCVTCGSSGMPGQFSVTDINGTFVATYNSTYHWWITGLVGTAAVTKVANCVSGACVWQGTVQSGNTGYGYIIECYGAGSMLIERYWLYVGSLSYPGAEYCPTTCETGSVNQGLISAIATGLTCGAIAWSGTPSTLSSGIPDPVGGAVSFTQ